MRSTTLFDRCLFESVTRKLHYIFVFSSAPSEVRLIRDFDLGLRLALPGPIRSQKPTKAAHRPSHQPTREQSYLIGCLPTNQITEIEI